jgi:hypothetical protein
MKNKNVTFMCVQPAIPYFAWQLEVMLQNFENLGIHHENQIDILLSYNPNDAEFEEKVNNMKKVEQRYKDVADFFYYPDTRQHPISYISSIRPNILKQHFKANPQLEEECVFYHDCDIIFTKYPDFIKGICVDDLNWYVSDTISYLGYDYVKSKGDDVLDAMCKIVGIHPELVKERQLQAGGAQYIMKKVDWVFWNKVEQDCEKLFKDITALNIQKKIADPTHHEIQIWCSDMWAIVWNAWMRGYNTKVIPEMNFCWATEPLERFDETYIMHNAGVTKAVADTHFFKGDYINELPYELTGEGYDQTKCSYKYFSIVQEIGKTSVLYEQN